MIGYLRTIKKAHMVRTQPAQGTGLLARSTINSEWVVLCFGITRNWWWGSQKSICVSPLFIRKFQLYIYNYIYIYIWLVVSNMFFSIIYEIILPIDFHIFQYGWNHQPDIKMLQQEPWGQSHSNSASWSLWVRPFTSLEIYICPLVNVYSLLLKIAQSK